MTNESFASFVLLEIPQSAHSSIHFLQFLRGRAAVAAGLAGCPRPPSHHQCFPGAPRQAAICSYSRAFTPAESDQDTSMGRRPDQVPKEQQRYSELPQNVRAPQRVSLAERTALQRNLISVTGICELVLLVNTRHSRS